MTNPLSAENVLCPCGMADNGYPSPCAKYVFDGATEYCSQCQHPQKCHTQEKAIKPELLGRAADALRAAYPESSKDVVQRLREAVVGENTAVLFMDAADEIERLQALMLRQTKLNTSMWQEGYNAGGAESETTFSDSIGQMTRAVPWEPGSLHRWAEFWSNAPATSRESAGWKEAAQQVLVALDRDASETAVAVNYVQNVPDHCDRIVWRGHYYHLENMRAVPETTEGYSQAYADRLHTALCRILVELSVLTNESLPAVRLAIINCTDHAGSALAGTSEKASETASGKTTYDKDTKIIERYAQLNNDAEDRLKHILERSSFPKARTDDASYILYLLADGEISVGKACEWLREYIASGRKGSLPKMSLEKASERKQCPHCGLWATSDNPLVCCPEKAYGECQGCKEDWYRQDKWHWDSLGHMHECNASKTKEPTMAMLPNDSHPGPSCSCRDCLDTYDVPHHKPTCAKFGTQASSWRRACDCGADPRDEDQAICIYCNKAFTGRKPKDGMCFKCRHGLSGSESET